MSDQPEQFDEATLQQMNEKEIRNQFFTPDNVYIELGLFKDLPLGCIFMDYIVLKNDEPGFTQFQSQLASVLPTYQTRLYDSIDQYLSPLGYTDKDVEEILTRPVYHDYIFMMAPMSQFFNTLIRHTIRNQNHSRPAEKFVKKKIDKDHYTLEPIDIVYRINTYPLKLSTTLLEKAGRELGESFGVNIEFMCKDPSLFDQTDWDTWMEKIDCFYLDSLGRFNRSPFVLEKQGAMQFSGCYFFVRKRLEKSVMEHKLSDEEFESEMQMGTARMALFCHFDWMQNNDLRLTQEADDVPMTDSQVSP